jgi:alkylated DNA repair dioxygenase AlkB
MDTLFPDIFQPNGFSYHPDFLSTEEETELIKAISATSLHPLIFQGFAAKRKVQSFGVDYNFDKRSVSPGKQIPNDFHFLLLKAAHLLSLSVSDFGEMLVTEYPEGSVINWHRDALPFDIVVGISLLSDCIFRFRPYDKQKQNRNAIIRFPVKRRSLYIIKDEARNDWEHSIDPVKQKRLSITLRTLRS